MKIQELMKEHPRCITADASLKEAAQMMSQIDCGILPVVEARDGRQPIGVITDRDIVTRCVSDGADPSQTRVQEAMTQDTVCCDLTCTAEDAFELMRREKVGRLLVTDEHGALCGIVSMADIIARVPREIWDQLPGAKGAKPRLAA